MFLKEGLMSPEELSTWFGISKKSFSNHRERKLNELELYADFEDMGRKGIYITKVKVADYKPSARKIVEQEFKEAWAENPNSLKYASNYIWNKRKHDFTVQEQTVYQYTCATKRAWYGIPHKESGSHGYCNWVYAVIDKANQKFRYLTEEEQQLRKEMLQIFFKDAAARIDEVKGLQRSLRLGEITTEEYARLSDQILGIAENGDWDKFNASFMEKIGESCDFALELIDNAWMEE